MKARTPYKKVTLSDVAREAKVSSSTVSRVLNNPGIVGTDTRQAILDAMSKLDYVYTKSTPQPVPSADSDAIKGTIAFIIPSDENPFYQTMISLVERALTSAGYLMLLCIFHNNPESINAYLQSLLIQRVDGCIMAFIKPDFQSGPFKKLISSIPCVSIQADIDGIDSVEADEESGSYEMLNQLFLLGHRKIGFVGYFSNLLSYNQRFGAYKKVHEDHSIPLRDEYISEYKGENGLDFQTSYREGCRLLSLPDRPTAIFCFNLKVAIGVYTAIRDYKLRIPEDISICGFDELQLAQIFSPPLSVVGMPMEAMVSSAIDFLRNRIDGNEPNTLQQVTFPTSVHRRASIGPVPTV